VRFVYLILICFAAPVAALTAWLRGRRDPSRRERLSDRFGRPQLEVSKPVLWVHAASMGEVQAGAVLVRRLLKEYPTHQVVVTTQTTTGAARVKELFGNQVQHCYLPYDLPFAVGGFLDRVQPRLALILETELWPTLFRACKRRGIPILIASARISPRSFARYRRLTSLFKPVLSRDIVVIAQSPDDAARFKLLGAGDVRIVGNIKFDIEVSETVKATGAAFRESISNPINLASRRFIWVAGSTHPSEEVAALAAHRRLMALQADALLVLVPRHPQRFEAVKTIIEQSGLTFVTRSSGAVVDAAVSVLLIDTMGELLNFYASADMAFVGGSLAPIGGHNLLEPAALAVPIVVGPYLSNAQDIADRMLSAGAARIVKSTEGLGDVVLDWARKPEARKKVGQNGANVVLGNRGAVDRVMALIAERLRIV